MSGIDAGIAGFRPEGCHIHGRLLIPFVMITEGALSSPLLYLSLYFKQRQQDYYAALDRVRTRGDWEGWLAFYLEGVAEVSEQPSTTAARLVALFNEHQAAIESLGRARFSGLKLHELFKRRCVLSIPVICKELGVSFPTASKTLAHLQKLGFVNEISGKRRRRVYSYAPYLQILQIGMER